MHLVPTNLEGSKPRNASGTAQWAYGYQLIGAEQREGIGAQSAQGSGSGVGSPR